MVAEHPVQGAEHGVGPEEVLVQCIISIHPFGRIQREQQWYLQLVENVKAEMAYKIELQCSTVYSTSTLVIINSKSVYYSA